MNMQRERKRFFRGVYDAMRLPGMIKRKKSTSTLPDVFPSSASLFASFPRQSQQGTLALPSKLDEVAESIHECVPQQLPGESASQDDVRYFLYQVLTLKEYNLARKSPQWVLETCMLWQGDGNRLRSLPLDAFQQLCPLHPGYAAIDWTVKGSKYRRQDIPPCGVRDEIGHRVKTIVEGLKRKEEGHRGPGWQNLSMSKPGAAPPVEMARTQNPTFPGNHRFQMAQFAPTSGFPVQNHFYSLGNHSMPLFHQVPPVGIQQNAPYMRRQPSITAPHYLPHVAGMEQHQPIAAGNSQHIPNGDRSSPVSLSGSPISSYCQTGSISSRLTESTAKTSPPISESEHQFRLSNIDQSSLTTESMSGSQCSLSSSCQDSPRRTQAVPPSRYRGTQPAPHSRLHDQSFHPAHYMTSLRSPSYNGSIYARSEASLTPSDSATNKYGFRRDSAMPPETIQQVVRSPSLYSPSIISNLSRPSTQQSFVTAPPCPQSVASPRLGTATPTIHGQNTFARPINNYRVDAHALDKAEMIGYKSMSGPMRSLMADEERTRKLTRDKSDARLNTCQNNSPKNVLGGEDPVGPLLRFQNPRTGQPRLTIYETIEQQERLGKQYLDNQRRGEVQQGRLRTVYETIEEQELLDRRAQRGLDNYVGQNWSNYL
ncbi:hypothetical protein C7974DRAFT_454943 [Boeremia exigua]|uniref:uncharacterized protein n=1 Tax=Boeremia exigua TaxID=749465 RepID=UPI001E8CFDC6|nr:uncharacterized protein C7974DRAFT_454943 [Boeremia exigua]KAH6629870.1 hypothetical protein C7974DRAFT_454943 [Boeremia exigua]